ncbi:MAG: hypothetical protein KGL39_07590 [Patescibacteria group bacterium]|nr:hypothetical protein [Patescibacteria group bacterium]
MSESMIERVGRAICLCEVGEERDRAVERGAAIAEVSDAWAARGRYRRHEEMYDGRARAAIEAMRDPTPTMLKAGKFWRLEMQLGNGQTVTVPGLGDRWYDYWRMIEAALAEPVGEGKKK